MPLEELQKKLPKGSMITRSLFEGSEIVFYTKNKNFFIHGGEDVKPLVQELRKRIDIRPDPEIRLAEDKAREKIMQIVPKDAEVQEIVFEPEFSRVVIYTKKPGLVVGKHGSTLRQIKEAVCWSPETRRIPLIKSDIVNKAREIVHKEAKYRQRFLNKIGEQIEIKKGAKDGWVRLSFLGSAREVGRSAILLQTRRSRVLLDCGVNVGSVDERNPYLDVPEFDIEALDAVIVSHAHLDHAGFIPYLYEYGYDGPVYLTPPTRDMMIMQQLDYIKTMQAETGKTPYTSDGVKNAIKHSISINYGSVCDITPDMRLTFQNAGHILGSALTHIHVGEGLHNLLYTADLNFSRSRLFDPASTNFQRIETLLMESTYGGPNDITPPKVEAEKNLLNIIDRTVKSGGRVIVPSFAVGRAQELMVFLADAARRKQIELPVYLDGMIWDATAIHTTYPDFLSRFLQRQIFHMGSNPFASDIFHRVGSMDERKALIEENEPSIIISTAGMVTGGPIIEYIRALGEDKKNSFVFVGYQAEGTLGRNIQMGWKDIPMSALGNAKEGDKRDVVRLKMDIETVPGFGAHSDRNRLLSFVHKLRSRPERIILNHGESRKIVNLMRTLYNQLKVETQAPHNLDAIRLK